MKIVGCTDGSEHSIKAIRWAAQFAINYKSDLIMLYVITDTIKTEGKIHWYKEHEEKGKKILDETKKAIEKEFPGLRVTVRLEGGDASKVIIDLAENEKIDIIVLGSRGLGTLKGLLLGSIAQKVGLHAPCPVTIVR